MSRIKGLTNTQAKALIKKYGLNKVETQGKRSFLTIFLSQFKNFFVYLLTAAALISFLVGEALDGTLILAIVFLNALFGLYQEWKADEALESLKRIMVLKARVIRDGKEKEIDSKYLVPGDVVVLEEGGRVPADGRIIETKVLEVDEAILTGESIPVSKGKGDEVFMGTLVVKGHGLFKVEKTGMNTSFGKIAEKLATVEKEKSPMEKKMEDLSKKLGLLGAFSALLIMVISYFKGLGGVYSFLLAVSLAVAVIPEGLPAVMTMTLAIGVREMAKQKAIVRRLSSIETLGSITLIATDKTGTLTENRMEVKETFLLQKRDEKAQELLILNSILCSTANLVKDGVGWSYLGDPTEGALLIYAAQRGYDIAYERGRWQVLEEEPFDSATKKMWVKVKNKSDGREIYFCKGAPEVVLKEAKEILIGGRVEKITQREKKVIYEKLDDWALQGFRVLAFSYKEKKEWVFIGMVALYDPPRKEVKEAIKKAQEAGIKTVMITGDNEKTARSIGQQIGLLQKGEIVLTGNKIEELTDEKILEILPQVKIFARVSPFHKVRIVELYQKLGEVVAVTGDGVNDSIALKKADVGLAMGKTGTDVARESADVIITDDNYATIVKAIEQGRNITASIKRSIFYLLSCNTGEVFSILISLGLGLVKLFTPVQILFINLVTDGVPALTFAFSPVDPKVMKRAPERRLSLISNERIKKILWAGFLSGVLTVVGVFTFGQNGFLFKRAVAFSTLVFLQTFIFAYIWFNGQFSLERLRKRTTKLFLFTFAFPFTIQFIIMRSEALASIFKSSTLSPALFLILVLYSGIIMVGLKLSTKL